MSETAYSTIEIAQIVFEIATRDLDFIELLNDRYEAFLTDQRPTIKIVIEEFKDIDYWRERQRSKFTDISEPILFSHALSEITFECYQNPFSARFDTETNTVAVTLNQEFKINCFDNLLRVLIGILLCSENAFMLHAAAVAKDGNAYVFFGKSESGKTTMTRMLNDSTILSDEIIIIKKIHGSYHVFGTPFWGEFYKAATNTSGELRKIYLLKKDEKNYVKTLSSKDAINKILDCVVFFGNRTTFVKDVFQNVVSFVEAVDIEELHFALDKIFCNQLISEDDHEFTTAAS